MSLIRVLLVRFTTGGCYFNLYSQLSSVTFCALDSSPLLRNGPYYLPGQRVTVHISLV